MEIQTPKEGHKIQEVWRYRAEQGQRNCSRDIKCGGLCDRTKVTYPLLNLQNANEWSKSTYNTRGIFLTCALKKYSHFIIVFVCLCQSQHDQSPSGFLARHHPYHSLLLSLNSICIILFFSFWMSSSSVPRGFGSCSSLCLEPSSSLSGLS